MSTSLFMQMYLIQQVISFNDDIVNVHMSFTSAIVLKVLFKGK